MLSLALGQLSAADARTVGPVTFSAPQTLAEDGLPLHNAHVAVGPTGRAAVLIDSLDGGAGSGGLQLSRLEPDGTPSSRTTIVPPDAGLRVGASAVAVDGTDRAVVAWAQGPAGVGSQTDELQVATVAPDGALGPVHRVLGGGPVDEVVLGLADSGAATIACDCPRGIESATVATDGTPGRPELVAALPGQGPHGALRRAVAPRIAVASDGSATVAWNVRIPLEGRRGVFRLAVRAAHVSPAGITGKARTLSGPDEDASGAAVGVDRRGLAFVAWRQAKPQAIVIQSLSRSGRPSSRRSLSQPRAFRAYGPQVAVDGGGERFVVWRSERRDPRYEARVNLAVLGRAGRPRTSVVTSYGDRGFAQQSKVGVDDAGRGVITWEANGVFAAPINGDGEVGPQVAVSPPGSETEYPDVAVGPTGAASVVFSHRIGDVGFAPTEVEESHALLSGS